MRGRLKKKSLEQPSERTLQVVLMILPMKLLVIQKQKLQMQESTWKKLKCLNPFCKEEKPLIFPELKFKKVINIIIIQNLRE
jgi:hypothetical protein